MMSRGTWPIIRTWFIVLLAAILIGLTVRIVRGQETPDEWFALVLAIEKQEKRLDADDRKFIRYMINVLTVEPDAIPKPEHRRWLLDIKRRLKVQP